MLHLSIKNEHSEIILQIRDWLLRHIDKDEFDIDIKSFLTFIETNSPNIGSYVHTELDDNFNEIVVIHIFDKTTAFILDEDHALKINAKYINSYWG